MRFKRYVAGQEKKGRSFAVVDGTNETYLFDIKDLAIPIRTFYTGRTYSEDEILMFFHMTEKYYGFRPEDGGLFLDIGANIGTTSVYVAKAYKESLEVIAFEPDPHNYKFLRINVSLNDCGNVVMENIGLSDRSEKKDMVVFPGNRGMNRMTTPASGRSPQGDSIIEVSAIPLDEYIEGHGIEKDRIRYIWIDVEGYEPYVIAGMSDLLSGRRIPLFMEFTNDIMDGDMFELLYGTVRKVYRNYVSIGVRTGRQEEHGITDLPDLYRDADEQCNLFFF